MLRRGGGTPGVTWGGGGVRRGAGRAEKVRRGDGGAA
jgi:hypothetical protein